MTNLEYYKDEIKEFIRKDLFSNIGISIGIAFRNFSEKHIKKYNCNADEFVSWLLEEHKEPIKLKQWEYDYITILVDNGIGDYIISATYIDSLITLGHYKGIIDESMKVKDIMENCIIVSDNYEGFEDCK